MEQLYSWLTVTLAQRVVMLAVGVQLASNKVPSLFFLANAPVKIEIILYFFGLNSFPSLLNICLPQSRGEVKHRTVISGLAFQPRSDRFSAGLLDLTCKTFEPVSLTLFKLLIFIC